MNENIIKQENIEAAWEALNVEIDKMVERCFVLPNTADVKVNENTLVYNGMQKSMGAGYDLALWCHHNEHEGTARAMVEILGKM